MESSSSVHLGHTILSFGKYRGRTFADVHSNEPHYVQGALSLDSATGPLKPFVTFCRLQATLSPAPSTPVQLTRSLSRARSRSAEKVRRRYPVPLLRKVIFPSELVIDTIVQIQDLKNSPQYNGKIGFVSAIQLPRVILKFTDSEKQLSVPWENLYVRSPYYGRYYSERKRRENDVARCLQEHGVFFTKEHHYNCSDGTTPRVDFFIVQHWGFVLLEVDENQHKGNELRDEVRMLKILGCLRTKSCKYRIVRFNPDVYEIDFCSQNTDMSTRHQCLLALIARAPMQPVELTYLFFDTVQDVPLNAAMTSFPAALRAVLAPRLPPC